MQLENAYKLVNKKARELYNEIPNVSIFRTKEQDILADYLLGVLAITENAPKNLKSALKYHAQKQDVSAYCKGRYFGLVAVSNVLTFSA